MARIVSFSYFLPYAGVPHAGGEYYLRHVRALIEAGHSVTLVAPATPEHTAAIPPDGVETILVEELHGPRERFGDLVDAQVRHAVLPTRFRGAVVKDPRVLAAARAADLLEFQWVPSASLYRSLTRRVGRSAPAVCIAHDVVGQSLRRQAAQPGLDLPRRAIKLVRAAIGGAEERRNLRAMDLVLTFSAKDRSLLHAYGVQSEVLDPPLADPAVHDPVGSPEEPHLLFVGAFDRMENQDAAAWLLAEIWPRVAAAHPSARLDLVGAHPTSVMRGAAQGSTAIAVSGYVDDLQPFYSRAALAVVPLRVGAGLKFKVVTAMLQGVPVITTSVGAEGIGDRASGLFVAIEDDARGFADAVIRHLDDDAPGRQRALAARQAASARYGWTGFRDRLDAAYRSLVDRAGNRA